MTKFHNIPVRSAIICPPRSSRHRLQSAGRYQRWYFTDRSPGIGFGNVILGLLFALAAIYLVYEFMRLS